MNQTKVSILIPFHNAAPYLKRTIQSALNQTYRNIEVILVDDGSIDESLSIASSFESDRVKIFTQKNSGACRARNKAFEESSGDYIQYLDGDDLLSNDKIKSQLDLLQRPVDDIVLSSKFIRFYDDSFLPSAEGRRSSLDRNWNDPIEWLIHEWEGGGMGQTSIWLTPRKLVEKAGPWDERLSINQDGEFFSRVLLHSSGIRFCNMGVVYYRSGNESSISQLRSHKKASDLLLSYRLYQQNIFRHVDNGRVRQALAAKYLSFIYIYYDTHDDLVKEARQLIDELAVKNVPLCGGINFKRLARIIGMNTALKFRSVMRKLGASAS